MGILQHKIILITGGSKGIGLECAKKYIQEGAQVIIVSNDEASVHTALSLLGTPAKGFICDIAREEEVEALFHKIDESYDRLDAIHNNAGIPGPSVALHQTTDKSWIDLFNINVKSIYYTTRCGIEMLKKSKGCILNTSSLVASIGQDNHAAYVATKGAVNALTKAMALDYAVYGIRVNAVAPAGVWTPMLREWAAMQKNKEDIVKYLNRIHPLGYCPEGDVVADVCAFLLSENARFITGNIMPVSGGAELGYRYADS